MAGAAATLALGGWAAGGTAGAAAVAACNAQISATTVIQGTPQTITVTGLDPNEPWFLTQVHDGQSSQGGTSPASASGGVQFTLTYAVGAWTDTFHGTTSGKTCSVSWTVLAATTTTAKPTTTTTVAPTTTAAAPTTDPPTTVSAGVAGTGATTVAPTPVTVAASLPRTGQDTGALAGLACGALTLGLAAVGLTRRRAGV